MLKRYSVAIAGSTQNTRLCAEALAADERFEITSILTPTPRVIGRKQLVTHNPLHAFAVEKNIAVVLVEKKINGDVQQEISALVEPDFLLVVDFGYIIPNWLLAWPKIAPLNIHPSLLPRWRGSSPGQFVLLNGEKESAVTLMVMDAQLDHGPIITQLPFSVEEKWTQTEYYAKSFALICEKLPALMTQFAEGTLVTTPQPEESPTAVAGRFQREDGFVSWSVLQEVLAADNTPLAQKLCNMIFALQPWPGVWTLVPTQNGEKRLKILDVDLVEGKLELLKVQLEGKNITSWNEIKNTL